MAGAKEIRGKIASIKNTQKITRAMEMISASKMRKAQERMVSSRPYARKIHQVIQHLAHSHSEYHHTYLQQREIKRVGYIVISTDRGLCGGFNINLFKKTLADINAFRAKDVEVDLCLMGRKADAFFRRHDVNIVGAAEHLGDKPEIRQLVGIVKVMLQAYNEGRLDAIYIMYNEFVNTMIQRPTKEQLLPLEPSDDKSLRHYWDYIYEPDAKDLLEQLLQRYIELQVYQASVENIASEQAARMVAMKSASDNAGDLIDRFQLIYNKARQAAITQEIAEIVGGAAAV